MPLNWNTLSLSERAEEILRNVTGLTPEDKKAIYSEWEKGEYSDTGFGHIQAEADLQRIAVEHLLKKTGKWEREKQRREDQLMQKVIN